MLVLVYPTNPEYEEPDLKLAYRLWGIIGIVLMNPLTWQGQKPLLTEFGNCHILESCELIDLGSILSC